MNNTFYIFKKGNKITKNEYRMATIAVFKNGKMIGKYCFSKKVPNKKDIVYMANIILRDHEIKKIFNKKNPPVICIKKNKNEKIYK